MLTIAALSALVALVPLSAAQASGSGMTTRYWDCCKPSCAWPGKADVMAPVTTCDIDNNPLTDPNAVSGCGGGNSYMCADQSPWGVTDDLAYGFAAVNIAGGSESSWCCACYELTFTSTAISGKKMIVQAVNTGGDLGSNQFDLAIPGGGVGAFNGCTQQYGPPPQGWGAQYGGISDGAQCSAFAPAIKPGCDFRFDWFQGAENPTVSFQEVTCPAALTAKSGCTRNGQTPTGPSSVGGSSGSSSSSKSSSSTSSKPAPTYTSETTTSTSSTPSPTTTSTPSSSPTTTSTPTSTSTSTSSNNNGGGNGGTNNGPTGPGGNGGTNNGATGPGGNGGTNNGATGPGGNGGTNNGATGPGGNGGTNNGATGPGGNGGSNNGNSSNAPPQTVTVTCTETSTSTATTTTTTTTTTTESPTCSNTQAPRAAPERRPHHRNRPNRRPN